MCSNLWATRQTGPARDLSSSSIPPSTSDVAKPRQALPEQTRHEQQHESQRNLTHHEGAHFVQGLPPAVPPAETKRLGPGTARRDLSSR